MQKEKKRKLVDVDPPPPDNLRCRRTDGKGWRCKNLIADNSNTNRYCEQHYQAILNRSALKSKPKSNSTNSKKKKKKNIKKDEEIPPETQMKTTSLDEGRGGGGGGLEEVQSETLAAARVSNASGGGGGLGKESESVAGVSNTRGGGGSSSKKTKTRFTQEQKEKMMEFGKRLGWSIKNHNEAAVQKFCDETGIKRLSLKGWMYNTKYALARISNSSGGIGNGSPLKKRSPSKFIQEQKDKMRTKKNILGYEPREGRADSQSNRRKVETQKRCLETETKRCSGEPKFRETFKHVGELEKVLEVDKTNELSVELEKKKMKCVEIQDKYRDGLKEWISCLEDQKVISEREKRVQERITNFRITRLEEDKKVICEREKSAQERITYMEEELRKMRRDEMEKFVQLNTRTRELECAKRRVDDEIEVCEKRFCDLESRVLRMEAENSSLKSMESHVCGHIDLEPLVLQNEDSQNDEGEICEKDRKKESKLQGENNGGTNRSHVAHLQTKEKVLNASEKILASASAFAGYGTQEGRAVFQINKRKVETGKRRSEAETKRCSQELKAEDSVENMKYLLELEKDLEVCKTKYHEVSVELEKTKIECIAIQEKYGVGLKEWTSCLEDQKVIGARQRWAQERITNLRVTSLEEDKKVISEREKRGYERIAYLEMELKKMGRDEREKYLQLTTDNKHLECARRRAEDETEAWKKRFCELEARVMRMEEENSTVRCMESHACGRREFGPGGLQNEVSHIDEGDIRENEINKMSKLQAKKSHGGTNSSHVAHLQTKDKVLNANEIIRASAFTGPSSINMQCEPSVNDEEKEKNTPSECKVEYRNEARKQVALDLEGNSNKRQSLLKLDGFGLESDGGTIEIRDSDNSSKRSWETEKDLTSNKCLKKPCLDQIGEEYGSSCGEFTFTPIHNKKRTSEIVTSKSEDADEVKMKKCLELEHEVFKPSPMNMFSETLIESIGGQHFDLRKKELKWKFEADMLSAFEEDPELCMKAVCALYRRQTSEENSMKGFLHYNNRGFNKFDALRGTNLAEFLLDGDRKGDLKKSVKELEMCDLKALEDCKRLAILYSEQLYTIYHNKEDPFFRPSSAGC